MPNDPNFEKESSPTFGQFAVEPLLIGQGAYSQVYSGLNLTTGEKVAVKVLSKNSKAYSICLMRELHALKVLNFSNVVKLYHFATDEDNAYLFMEYLPFQNLESYLTLKGPLDIKEARIIFHQLCQTLTAVHQKKFAHHDLKLDNILFDPTDHQIKLIDFGLSIYSPDPNKKATQFSGTPYYMAPEILIKRPFNAMIADIWSLGVILFQLTFGKLPFEAQDLKLLRMHVLRDNLVFPKPVSPILENLLYRLLEKDPEKRISMKQVLAHEWFNEEIL